MQYDVTPKSVYHSGRNWQATYHFPVELIAALERDARNRAESRKQISLAAMPAVYRQSGESD